MIERLEPLLVDPGVLCGMQTASTVSFVTSLPPPDASAAAQVAEYASTRANTRIFSATGLTLPRPASWRPH